MPFNGNGVYAAPALPGSFNPATTGSSATPADWNTLLADISTALSTTITKDGQTTVTADIPMATHKITGLGSGTALTDAAALTQTWFTSSALGLSTQAVVAAATVDFTGIDASINNLMLLVELRPSTDGTNLLMQTYGADGVLDTGAGDYSYQQLIVTTAGGTAAFGSAGNSSILLASSVDNGTAGASFTIAANNIQALTATKFNIQGFWQDVAGVLIISNFGGGARGEADRITGIRISPSGGTVTGRVTLMGSL